MLGAKQGQAMYLTGRETKSMLKVVQALSGEEQFNIRRIDAGRALLDLLHADHFASFHWNEERRCFSDRIIINMSEANLEKYERYYQFHDPITLPMQRTRCAVSVNQIMDQRDFERTEFYNDFLRCDGLYYGVNLHVYDGDFPIADWRIWRKRGRENFERHSLEMLDFLAPHLRNATRLDRLVRPQRTPWSASLSATAIRDCTGLSSREAQIAYHAMLGKADQEIADTLFLSRATVRTHLRHIYHKLGVGNRSSLCRKIAESHSPPTPSPAALLR